MYAARLLVPVSASGPAQPRGGYVAELPQKLRAAGDVHAALEWLFTRDNNELAARHGLPQAAAVEQTLPLGYIDVFVLLGRDGRPVLVAVPLSAGWAYAELRGGKARVRVRGEAISLPREKIEQLVKLLAALAARGVLAPPRRPA